jgi:hypothetical protein
VQFIKSSFSVYDRDEIVDALIIARLRKNSAPKSFDVKFFSISEESMRATSQESQSRRWLCGQSVLGSTGFRIGRRGLLDSINSSDLQDVSFLDSQGENN